MPRETTGVRSKQGRGQCSRGCTLNVSCPAELMNGLGRVLGPEELVYPALLTWRSCQFLLRAKEGFDTGKTTSVHACRDGSRKMRTHCPLRSTEQDGSCLSVHDAESLAYLPQFDKLAGSYQQHRNSVWWAAVHLQHVDFVRLVVIRRLCSTSQVSPRPPPIHPLTKLLARIFFFW